MQRSVAYHAHLRAQDLQVERWLHTALERAQTGQLRGDIRKILEPNRVPLQAKSLLSSEKTLTLFKNYGSYLASADGEILPAPAA